MKNLSLKYSFSKRLLRKIKQPNLLIDAWYNTAKDCLYMPAKNSKTNSKPNVTKVFNTLQ